MPRGTDVNFEYEYELPEPNGDGEYETLLLDVNAHISDYHPAVMYLRNGDPGYPAEGGEVEDLTIIGPDGVEWDSISEVLMSKLEDMAYDEASF